MSKHEILTDDEFLKHAPNKRIIDFINEYRKRQNLKESEINILDWGCGRGRDVLWLREHGYNAFGVDIDSEPIKNGLYLFRKKGYDDSSLLMIDSESKTSFPDRFFDITFSSQVFEHIRDLNKVASEIGRITKMGGIGYHIYPAHKYITEGHLYMPFIHWLPKNRLRKYLILFYVIIGKEPRWIISSNGSISEKTKVYFNYSITKTYYRKYHEVREIFQNNGFRVNFQTINNPALRKNRLVYNLANYHLSKPIINYLLLTFRSVELFLTKL